MLVAHPTGTHSPGELGKVAQTAGDLLKSGSEIAGAGCCKQSLAFDDAKSAKWQQSHMLQGLLTVARWIVSHRFKIGMLHRMVATSDLR